MAAGLLVVDVCNADDDKALKKLVANSVDFWVRQEGYTLISNDEGSPDLLIMHPAPSLKDGKYEPGEGKSTKGKVILVFQKG